MLLPTVIAIWLAGLLFPMAASAQGSGTPYLSTFQNETPITPRDEVRALWVVRDALTSQRRIDELIDFCVRSRFQMIFAQVRGRGDAYYQSPFEPEGRGLELPASEFDPLHYLLARAHASGISVHVWVNVYYVWSDPSSNPPSDHVVSRKPQWLIVDPEGNRTDGQKANAWLRLGAEGYFLSPANEEARAFIIRVIQDIAGRYAIDGVHLDYVRYPAAGFGLNPQIRRDFTLYWGTDPLYQGRVRESIAGPAGDRAAAVFDSLIIEGRVQAVDSLVRGVRVVIGDLPLSAAVIPENQQARNEKGQGWVRWVQEGTVDFVVPMAYSYTPQELKKKMRLIRNLIGRDKFLVGLPLFDG
ncbi:MAG: family 10 glycosylhydrolase, partial [Candidatus Latescibacterota bacterium]